MMGRSHSAGIMMASVATLISLLAMLSMCPRVESAEIFEEFQRTEPVSDVHQRGRRYGAVAESQAIPDDLKDFIVAEHNRLRGSVDPPATNMKTMQWDDNVAAWAVQWSKCENWFIPSIAPWPERYGENIYGARGYPSDLKSHLARAMELWWAEEENYDYSSGTCEGGWGLCAHYTQMAWADTYAIGCGYMENCPWAWGDFQLVCDYKTPGNYWGQNPYATI